MNITEIGCSELDRLNKSHTQGIEAGRYVDRKCFQSDDNNVIGVVYLDSFATDIEWHPWQYAIRQLDRARSVLMMRDARFETRELAIAALMEEMKRLALAVRPITTLEFERLAKPPLPRLSPLSKMTDYFVDDHDLVPGVIVYDLEDDGWDYLILKPDADVVPFWVHRHSEFPTQRQAEVALKTEIDETAAAK